MIDKKTYKAVSNLVLKYVENTDVISTITSFVGGHIRISFNIWSGIGSDRRYVGTVSEHIYSLEDYNEKEDSIVEKVENLLNQRNGIRT